VLYTLARQAGTALGANFCDEEDAVLQAVKNWVLTGTEDGSGEPLIRDLTPDRVQIRLERYNADPASWKNALAACRVATWPMAV
jgi:hypothetical protein